MLNVSLVYFVQQDSLIKIGTTYNFDQRYATLERIYGTIELVYVMHGDNRLESAFHKSFRSLRAVNKRSREWFHRSGKLADFLTEHQLNDQELAGRLKMIREEARINKEFQYEPPLNPAFNGLEKLF